MSATKKRGGGRDGVPAGGAETDRATLWAATMAGHILDPGSGVTVAHATSRAVTGAVARRARDERESEQDGTLAPGATRARGAGRRSRPEKPDALRTCFERDRDRVLHSAAFRRLAGKTQVFIDPLDHQRTRLTHAMEVAQVALAIARATRLNEDLVYAASIAHDCGHGPGGHASEEAFGPFVEGGFDHASWGADVALRPLNLCEETLDAVRNHSWSRPAPGTPEGEVLSWADRIAYVCHDFEDAVAAGIVKPDEIPRLVAQRCGSTRAAQISTFISGVIEAVERTGAVGMTNECAEALASFRAWNYERIYLRPDSLEQGRRVRRLLEALVEAYALAPELLPEGRARELGAQTPEAWRAAVEYVAGMTDRFAVEAASRLLDWPEDELPARYLVRGA
ncbi:MAG: HD domain-containing protein [Acidimicrobiales bacterium]